MARSPIKRNPFHPFSSFHTATLCGVACGQTVLARAVKAAGLSWDEDSAHSAAYDAAIRTDVFCDIVNRFQSLFTSITPQDWSEEEDNLQEPLIQDVRADDQALIRFDRLRFLELSGIGIVFLLGVASGRPM